MYSKFHILIADDSDEDVFLLKRAFDKLGINAPTQIVTDGAMAMEYLQGEKEFRDRKKYPLPWLILLDIKMPLRNGFDVLRWLRKHPDLALLPVIMLSSSREEKDVDLAHRLGANGYNVKPVDLVGFKHLVEGLEKFWFRLHIYPTPCNCSK